MSTETLPAIPDLSITSAIAKAIEHETSTILACPAVDDATAQWLVDAGHRLKAIGDVIDKQTEPATELRRIADKISKPFVPAKKLLAKALDHCRRAPIEYRQRKEAEARKALEAAASSGAGAVEIKRAAEIIAAPVQGLTEVEHWTYEITDRTKIPLEYFVLDEARLAREAKALKDKFDVPGVRAVKETRGQLRR